jgi:hypothetical protein
MSKKGGLSRVEPKYKHTSQATHPGAMKTSSMNKSKRRATKAYRGQGR